MASRNSKNPLKHLRATDLRGVAQLVTQATAGVTRIAEGVHQSVWSSMGVSGRSAGQTGGLTGLVYQAVHGVTQLLGSGADRLLTQLQPALQALDADAQETAQRQAVLAALNGVMGDRLLAAGNPLATPMQLRLHGQLLDSPPQRSAVTGKVLLLVHGLCMNDLQWQREQDGKPFSHGDALAAALGYTPVTLRYNSGLHTSQNGRELAGHLEQLLAQWPVAVEEFSVLVHSMGGLVIRSAVHCATQQRMGWPRHLKNIAFLGTPHHGAPLERAGNWLDVILGSTPYTAPFARLAKLRSAGVTDLRYGHVLDADWQGRDRFARSPDRRTPLPLPEGVRCFTVAATTAVKRSLLAERLVGDGLVPLRSALGQHDEARRTLAFARDAQLVVYRTNHMQLLDSPQVAQQLLRWFAPAT